MLKSYYSKYLFKFENKLKVSYWYLYTALCTAMVIWFLTAPSYFALTKEFRTGAVNVDFQEKINRADHLLKPTIYPDNYHMAKTQLRLTIPLIAKMIGTRSKVVMFFVQEILGLIFLSVACLLTFKLTHDRIVSAVMTLSLGFIYAGKAAFVDIVGFTDSFAYCFLMLALFTNNRVFLILNLLLAFFTDERAIISSFLIAILYYVEYLQQSDNKFMWRVFIKSRFLVIIFSWVLCFIIRFTLFKLYGLHTPTAGANTIDLFPLGYIFWDGLQGFWLIVIGGCLYLLFEKRFFLLFLIITGIALQMVTTSLVSDVTRSIAYIFPVIFLGLFFLQRAVSIGLLRKIVIISCFVSLMSADSFYIVGGDPKYYKSLPLKIIEKVFIKHNAGSYFKWL